MSNIDEVYRDLTGVDIRAQKILWDERGKGYYGEYLVFKELYPKLAGHCKILMNLQIPTGDGRSTEIDLLLIHETGLYVFEMKHYKGTIYGKASDQKWTQYFRTTPNSHFYNPILQNQYHIRALQNRFPSIPVHSLIVFTNPECSLNISCNDPNITVCHLSNIRILHHQLEKRSKLFDIDRIDALFNELVPFSPATNKTVIVNDTSMPLYLYVNTIIEDFQKEKEKSELSYHAVKRAAKNKMLLAIILSSVAVFLCIVLSIFSCAAYCSYADRKIAAAEKELNNFAQKFEPVDVFNNGDLNFSQTLVDVSDVVITPSSDLDNTTLVSCKLTYTGTDYGVFVNQDTSITVILKDGTVKECKVFNEKYPYHSNVYLDKYVNQHASILPHEFYSLSIDDIAYIKLTNVGVWTHVRTQRTTVSTSYEIKIYEAE